MAELETSDALGQELQGAWYRYLDLLVPLRPALFGYCRRLTGSVWDAEDLAQETLLRAFARWGNTQPPIRNPQAYLLRTATHLWIDTVRRRQTEARAPEADPTQQAAPGAAPDVSSAVWAMYQR